VSASAKKDAARDLRFHHDAYREAVKKSVLLVARGSTNPAQLADARDLLTFHGHRIWEELTKVGLPVEGK
jgi:hypothetical protein